MVVHKKSIKKLIDCGMKSAIYAKYCDYDLKIV